MAFPTFDRPDDLTRLARRIWYWPFVRGLLALGFGAAAILLPTTTPGLLVQVLGAFVALDGVVSLVDCARRRGTRAGSANLGLGLAAVVLGAVLLLAPQAVLGVVLVLVAVWAAGLGVLQLVVASALRPRGGTAWVWTLVAGVLLLALAVVCLVNPDASVAVMSVLVGVVAVVVGSALLALGLRLRSFARAGSWPGGPGGGRVIEGRVEEM
ncbi:HdeD family acid-resistance protein [Isoptericola variabilis]|uniref:HdeD family acid-resistance protein n=1 Tax=Isoptericola variabilis (strain 225) TaxID=743718 RepID=F6FT62_ISOV2|nr:DUF308 domain-containing protein [Isoptericola variabilis]AEG44133.1 protein of unknown function DUF308 membrane [Isoptericola variabilis 225]TWH28553.1 uncharacterized membrane protein HdeD (DUF308 family) [Isoptericola variabilis J7]